MGSNKVELHVYDLSYGIAKYVSPFIVGKFVEGVWHTSVVAYGHEYSYGNDGVNIVSEPSKPLKTIFIGYTATPKYAADMFVEQMKNYDYVVETYDFLQNNCHRFANDLCQFLCNRNIPKMYTDLPENVFGKDIVAGARRAVMRGGRLASGSSAASTASGVGYLFPFLASSSLNSVSSCKHLN